MQTTQARCALVVDDQPLILLHATAILEDFGFGTVTAASAGEAITQLEAHGGIVLLLTDVDLHGEMDGFALARKTAERWPVIGILVASGRRTPKDGDMPTDAIFVAKPFSADIIHDRLQKLLPDEHKPGPLASSYISKQVVADTARYEALAREHDADLSERVSPRR